MRRKITGAMRSVLLAPYRAKLDVPTELSDTAPAPPWVPAVIDTIYPRVDPFLANVLIAEVLAWCAEGEPVSRAERVILLAHLWAGDRTLMLQRFLEAVRKTKSGRPKTARVRHVEPLQVCETWPTRSGGPFEHVARPKVGHGGCGAHSPQ